LLLYTGRRCCEHTTGDTGDACTKANAVRGGACLLLLHVRLHLWLVGWGSLCFFWLLPRHAGKQSIEKEGVREREGDKKREFLYNVRIAAGATAGANPPLKKRRRIQSTDHTLCTCLSRHCLISALASDISDYEHL
jgi:hypothetical protein